MNLKFMNQSLSFTVMSNMSTDDIAWIYSESKTNLTSAVFDLRLPNAKNSCSNVA